MKYNYKQFPKLTDEQKQEYLQERLNICSDFKMSGSGICLRYKHYEKDSIGFCNYSAIENKKHGTYSVKPGDEVENEHFVCEFSQEFRKKIVERLCES